jgi:hypothetical protein
MRMIRLCGQDWRDLSRFAKDAKTARTWTSSHPFHHRPAELAKVAAQPRCPLP